METEVDELQKLEEVSDEVVEKETLNNLEETEENKNNEQDTEDLKDVEDDTITLTKKELQSKLDSFSDKKMNSVLSKKNDELENLKEKLKEYEETSAEEFKGKILEKSKLELNEQYSNIEKELKEKELMLLKKEEEINEISKKFAYKLDLQATKEQLKALDLPESLASELVDKYGDNKTAITKRINSLKDEYDLKYNEVINKKIALKNPKLQDKLVNNSNSDNYSGMTTSQIIRAIKANKKNKK